MSPSRTGRSQNVWRMMKIQLKVSTTFCISLYIVPDLCLGVVYHPAWTEVNNDPSSAEKYMSIFPLLIFIFLTYPYID